MYVHSHDRGDFKNLKNQNILIYWPHGFGDQIFVSYILPLLEKSNTYWITRFGDDNVYIHDGTDKVKTIKTGYNSTHCSDGGKYGCKHFSLEYHTVDGTLKPLKLPISLYEVCKKNNIRHMLWSWFPETHGNSEFPFHTKGRNLLKFLTDYKKEDKTIFSSLQTYISLAPTPLDAMIESRLQNKIGLDAKKKLCIISRVGYTAIGKNWGHEFREDLVEEKRHEGEEVRDFIKLLKEHDDKWIFLVMEDRHFTEKNTVKNLEHHCYSYADVFGTPDLSFLPFGMIIQTLIRRANLTIGVPTGPYHLSMACNTHPTIGIWIEHLPSWYDEPKDESIHIISKNIYDRGLDKRPGSFFKKESLEYKHVLSPTRPILGEFVIDNIKKLI